MKIEPCNRQRSEINHSNKDMKVMMRPTIIPGPVQIRDDERYRLKTLTMIHVYDPATHRLLLGYKARGFGKGKWNGFGGKVDPSDVCIRDGAVRELQEETGLSVQSPDHMQRRAVLLYRYPDHLSADILEVHVYVVLKQHTVGVVTPSEEMVPIEWWDAHAVPLETMWADDEWWLPALLSDLQRETGAVEENKSQEVGPTTIPAGYVSSPRCFIGRFDFLSFEKIASFSIDYECNLMQLCDAHRVNRLTGSSCNANQNTGIADESKEDMTSSPFYPQADVAQIGGLLTLDLSDNNIYINDSINERFFDDELGSDGAKRAARHITLQYRTSQPNSYGYEMIGISRRYCHIQVLAALSGSFSMYPRPVACLSIPICIFDEDDDSDADCNKKYNPDVIMEKVFIDTWRLSLESLTLSFMNVGPLSEKKRPNDDDLLPDVLKKSLLCLKGIFLCPGDKEAEIPHHASFMKLKELSINFDTTAPHCLDNNDAFLATMTVVANITPAMRRVNIQLQIYDKDVSTENFFSAEQEASLVMSIRSQFLAAFPSRKNIEINVNTCHL